MNWFVVVLACAGIALVMANELVAARQRTTVEYRYLPRDLDTYMREEPYASVTFQSMFNDENLPFPRAQLTTSQAAATRPNSAMSARMMTSNSVTQPPPLALPTPQASQPTPRAV